MEDSDGNSLSVSHQWELVEDVSTSERAQSLPSVKKESHGKIDHHWDATKGKDILYTHTSVSAHLAA